MGKSSDEIRQEIEDQRADAGQKIDDLQGQLKGQADHMQQQVQDTAEHVRSQAQGVMDDAVSTVQNFDFHQQVQDRPLVSVGAALVGGFLLGGMLGGGKSHQQSGGGSSQASHQGGGLTSGVRSAAQKSGLEDTISNAAAALMGSLTEQVKNALDSKMPGYADKLDSAQRSSGSFTDKAKATQQDAQRA